MADSTAQPIQTTDEGEQAQLNQLASHVSQATATPTSQKDLTPPVNQPLVVQVPEEEEVDNTPKKEENRPEIIDLMHGLQGKPRTAEASSFLKEKMKWLAKKHPGSSVSLGDKK